MTAWRIADDRRMPKSLTLAVVAIVALLTSCGVDGDTAGTATTRPRTTTTTATTTITTTTGRAGLFGKLPDSEAIGHGYHLDRSSRTHPPKPFDPATTTTTTATSFNVIDRHCPGANWPRLDSSPDVAGVEYVKFVDKDERELWVGVAPKPSSMDRSEMSRLLHAIQACGKITENNGPIIEIDKLTATEVGDLGDYGIDIAHIRHGGATPGSPHAHRSDRSNVSVRR